MVKANDYFIISCLVKMAGVEAPAFWDSIRDTLYYGGVLFSFLKTHLTEQIMLTLDKSHLFRVNYGLTFLMASIMKQDNQKVLTDYVNPIIQAINDLPDALEVDPTKTSVELAKANAEMLVKVMQVNVFDRIDKLSSFIPPSLKFLFTVVKTEVNKKWPGNGLISVGGFIFLRFINPALVAPQRFGDLMIKPNDNAKRTLILLSKIMQAIANQSSEPFNEMFMQPFGEFVVPQYLNVNKFLEEISEVYEEPTVVGYMGEENIPQDVTTIIKGICGFKPAFQKEFIEFLDLKPGVRKQFINVLRD